MLSQSEQSKVNPFPVVGNNRKPYLENEKMNYNEPWKREACKEAMKILTEGGRGLSDVSPESYDEYVNYVYGLIKQALEGQKE